MGHQQRELRETLFFGRFGRQAGEYGHLPGYNRRSSFGLCHRPLVTNHPRVIKRLLQADRGQKYNQNLAQRRLVKETFHLTQECRFIEVNDVIIFLWTTCQGTIREGLSKRCEEVQWQFM